MLNEIRCPAPASVIATQYGAQRRQVGRSSARSRKYAAAAIAQVTSAYERASWAYRETSGGTANSRPAPTAATRLSNSRRAVSATNAAAPAMASTDGIRRATVESPNTAVQPCISR